MRFMHANDGVAQADTEAEIPFVNGVGGDPAVSPSTDPGGLDEPFKADWIEVTNQGTGGEVLLANPFGSIVGGRTGVVIRDGETYRFEWGAENKGARDKGGFTSIFLLSTVGGTTVGITAGAE